MNILFSYLFYILIGQLETSKKSFMSKTTWLNGDDLSSIAFYCISSSDSYPIIMTVDLPDTSEENGLS